jgi:hypothetical protein
MTWQQRFNDVAQLDGEEWDAAHEQLQRDWIVAYSEAFISIAVSRGWQHADAATWPHEIGDDAFIECYQHDCDPERAALSDVVSCEQEAE